MGIYFQQRNKTVLKSKTECTVVCFLEKGMENRPQTVISSQLQKKQKCLSVLTLRSVFHAFFSFYWDPVFPLLNVLRNMRGSNSWIVLKRNFKISFSVFFFCKNLPIFFMNVPALFTWYNLPPTSFLNYSQFKLVIFFYGRR